MEFEWIRCKDRLPKNPKSPVDENRYFVVVKTKHGHNFYTTAEYADGWNCSLRFDGTISRKYEWKDVIAWAEIPEYKD